MKKSEKILTMPIVVALLAMLCCALWGSATPFIKMGYEMILPWKGTPSVMLFAGLRFTFAGIFTIAIYSISRRKFLYPKLQNIDKVLKISTFQTVLQYVCFYIGLAHTTGTKGTLFSSSSTFFSVLIAALIFRQEKLTFRKLLGCILGFTGIVVVSMEGNGFDVNLLGDGLVLLSGVANGVSAAMIKRYSKYEDPVVLSGYQFFVGGIVMTLIGLVMGGRIQIVDLPSLGVFVYLAFLSAAAYSLWGVLLKHNSVSSVTIYSFTMPVFGILLTNLLLSEQNVTIDKLIISLILVCVGILVLNYQKKSTANELKK